MWVAANGYSKANSKVYAINFFDSVNEFSFVKVFEKFLLIKISKSFLALSAGSIVVSSFGF